LGQASWCSLRALLARRKKDLPSGIQIHRENA
jgi:hypothetical protein